MDTPSHLNAGNDPTTEVDERRPAAAEARVGPLDTRTETLGAMGVWLHHNWAPLLAAVAGTIAVAIAILFAKQPLLEHGAWRQTQTALTSYWLIREGWQLAYQTPVLGYPWSIPLELPIYQALVALIVRLTGLPLDPVGRLTSFAFLLACAWPAFQILRRLGLPSVVAWVFCALLWSSPQYLFYGRNFLMETAAVFFMFAAIPYALDLRDPRPRFRSALLFSVFATLGMLQKITTGLPVLLVLAVVLVVSHLRHHGLRLPSLRKFLLVPGAFALALIVNVAWLAYSDAVKAQNHLMSAMHNNQSMIRAWLGANDVRFNVLAMRTVFWDRVITNNAAGFLGLLVLLAGVLFGRERRAIIMTGLVLFVTPIFLFARHQHFLDYYQTSAVIFMLGALAVALVVPLPKLERARWLTPLLVLLVVSSNFYHFQHGYGTYVRLSLNESNDATLAVSDVVRRYSPANSGIVVFGLFSRGSLFPISAWSSEVAYYSERKSLTVSDEADEPTWSDPASFLGPLSLGAMVFCSADERDKYNRIIAKYASSYNARLFPIHGCNVWLPDVESVVLPDGRRVWPVQSLQFAK
jgi:hypothetical protein